MAFVVEDGTGLTTANAYVAVAFANAYHKDRGNAGWTGSGSDKEDAIVQATDYINATYQFRGRKLVARRAGNLTSQALAWPREFVQTLPELEDVPDDAVPVEVQQACAEFALANLTGTTLLPDAVSSNLAAESKGAGPLNRSQTFRRAATQPVFHLANRILAPLVVPDALLRA